MEKTVESYISWYKDERQKFVSENYVDKSTFLKSLIVPYSNWDASAIIGSELDFAAKAIAKFESIDVKDTKASNKEKQISLLSTSILNRAEYISDQADFYPILAFLISFISTYITIGQLLGIKILISSLALIGVILALKKRADLRLEVCYYKEIANIMNQFKRHDA